MCRAPNRPRRRIIQLTSISLQEPTYSIGKMRRVDLTLPDDEDLPSVPLELLLRFKVPPPVLLQLRLPEVEPRFWHSSKPACRAGMAVPKTSVHENDFTSGGNTMSGLPGSLQTWSR